MFKVPDRLKTIWTWFIELLLHTTWGYGLLLLVSALFVGVGGITLGESKLKQDEREGVDQLVSVGIALGLLKERVLI